MDQYFLVLFYHTMDFLFTNDRFFLIFIFALKSFESRSTVGYERNLSIDLFPIKEVMKNKIPLL